MEYYFIMLIVFAPYVVGPVMMLAGIVWMVREFAVKSPRRRRWIAAHNGHLIGSEEFFNWCEQEGVNPDYYL